ncbi:MAG: rod shape-determining protein MreC [Nitrospiraceae bacterium]|nr:rod shape-determining protein MreC [Nitrospiraceae bacterium]
MQGRRFLPLILLVIFTSALMTYQARKGSIDPLGPVNGFMYTISGGISGAFSSVSGFLGNFGYYAARAKDLEKENAALRNKLAQTAEIQKENERLRQLLDIKQHLPDYVASANVIARGAKRWANTFTIDAGSNEGIRKDMTVISPQGLAGKVIRVEPGYSLVLLINDVRFAASARLEQSRQEVIFSGTGGRDCELRYVTSDVKVNKGEVLVTSGLDGLFPEGIRVGYVKQVSDEDGFFRKVDVVPFADTTSLEEVAVISR